MSKNNFSESDKFYNKAKGLYPGCIHPSMDNEGTTVNLVAHDEFEIYDILSNLNSNEPPEINTCILEQKNNESSILVKEGYGHI